jgi:hypothetical protein
MNNSAKATAIFTFISILFFAGSARSQISDSIYTLKKGTQIRVRMDNEINSEVSSVGDTFTATVSSPVNMRGVEILALGMIIEGKIISVKSASRRKKNGSFEVKFETLYLPNGVKRQIAAGLVSLEKPTSSQGVTVATIAGATGLGALFGTFFEKAKGALTGAGVGLAVATAAILLQKGKETRIKAGEEFNIVLKQDVTLPPQDY